MAIERAYGPMKGSIEQLRMELLGPVSPRKNGRSARALAKHQNAIADESAARRKAAKSSSAATTKDV